MTRKLLFYLPILLLTTQLATAQFSENFTDGNFTVNPVWAGNTNDWIVNSAGQLQSNNSVANSIFYLSTASTLATAAQWELYVDLKFATSGSNYVDVYLTASASDITALATSGYFVRIGGTADEISLYRKDAGKATVVNIINGVDGSTNSSSNNQIKIKVLRNADSQWTLLRDMSGTGNNYFTEGNVTDATLSTSAFFGILVKQSTVAGFAKKHFFDSIIVKAYTPDTTPPVVQTATIKTPNTLDVLFDESLDKSSVENIVNYTVDNGIGNPIIALLDTINKALVHVTFTNNFPDGINCLLTVNGVKDIAANTLLNSTISFIYHAPYTARQYDILIEEIMANPAPPVALPNTEWIELKNTSTHAINLQGWKINTTTGSSGPMPNFTLQPDSFVIVCTGSAVAAMAAFGTIISVTNFPSIDNTSGLLSLISLAGKTIHAVGYSINWYQNELKKNGGWSLEMIDTKNPCSGNSNWIASTDLRGGSPGSKNTVNAINIDKIAPRLLHANAADNINTTLVFDEPLDSTKAATANNYSISDGIGTPISAVALPPLFNTINLKLGKPLLAGKIYTITATAITDCAGNAINTMHIAKVGLSTVADSLDIVINEILYNPLPMGSDYIELYNRSNKAIDLKQTFIANRGTNGAVSNITQISSENLLLFPQDFMLLTKDILAVKAAYILQDPAAFITVNLPSYNNDKGDVIILNAQGNITDEVAYDDKWQFKLLANTQGVSLERIDYNRPSQSADNWHSAATSAGYGTPTYKNSQYHINDEVQGDLQITPAIVSPDNDGQDDFATINYNFPSAGYVANITIFDASGRPVRYLQRNALCGTSGSFRWDGLGEKNQSLAIGIYIIYTAIFNLKGNTKIFKLPIVLARRK